MQRQELTLGDKLKEGTAGSYVYVDQYKFSHSEPNYRYSIDKYSKAQNIMHIDYGDGEMITAKIFPDHLNDGAIPTYMLSPKELPKLFDPKQIGNVVPNLSSKEGFIPTGQAFPPSQVGYTSQDRDMKA